MKNIEDIPFLAAPPGCPCNKLPPPPEPKPSKPEGTPEPSGTPSTGRDEPTIPPLSPGHGRPQGSIKIPPRRPDGGDGSGGKDAPGREGPVRIPGGDDVPSGTPPFRPDLPIIPWKGGKPDVPGPKLPVRPKPPIVRDGVPYEPLIPLTPWEQGKTDRKGPTPSGSPTPGPSSTFPAPSLKTRTVPVVDRQGKIYAYDQVPVGQLPACPAGQSVVKNMERGGLVCMDDDEIVPMDGMVVNPNIITPAPADMVKIPAGALSPMASGSASSSGSASGSASSSGSASGSAKASGSINIKLGLKGSPSEGAGEAEVSEETGETVALYEDVTEDDVALGAARPGMVFLRRINTLGKVIGKTPVPAHLVPSCPRGKVPVVAEWDSKIYCWSFGVQNTVQGAADVDGSVGAVMGGNVHMLSPKDGGSSGGRKEPPARVFLPVVNRRGAVIGTRTALVSPSILRSATGLHIGPDGRVKGFIQRSPVTYDEAKKQAEAYAASKGYTLGWGEFCTEGTPEHFKMTFGGYEFTIFTGECVSAEPPPQQQPPAPQGGPLRVPGKK